eukprot:6064550-Pleurochrysis_carterae.AAC.2
MGDNNRLLSLSSSHFSARAASPIWSTNLAFRILSMNLKACIMPACRDHRQGEDAPASRLRSAPLGARLPYFLDIWA